jgi:hypothetical protein
MIENLYEQTMEGLLKKYTEARQVGAVELCDETWKKMIEIDKQQTRRRLDDLRFELDGVCAREANHPAPRE